MSRFVAIIDNGVRSVHISGDQLMGDYETLCGMDGHDDSPDVKQSMGKVKRGEKIDCEHCIDIWKACKRYSASDFKDPARGCQF